MSTARQDARSAAREVSGGDPRRWRALGVLAAVQFMLVLDIMVVTVALPRHRRSGRDAGLGYLRGR